MANPRKFSEKIALHTQKQAEETSAFERILREVMVARGGPTETLNGNSPTNTVTNFANSVQLSSHLQQQQQQQPPPQQQQQPQQQQHQQQNPDRLGAPMGFPRTASMPHLTDRSLPNGGSSIDLRTALQNLEQMGADPDSQSALQQQHQQNGRRALSPAGRTLRFNSIGSHQGYASASTTPTGVAPQFGQYQPISRQHHKRSVSPYSNQAYLSPPPPDQWRRASSDSALNQTGYENTQQVILDSTGTVTQNGVVYRRTSPTMNVPQNCHNGNQHYQQTNGGPGNEFLLSASYPENGSRSPCEVPNINIIFQEENNAMHTLAAPDHSSGVSSISGSLPDLTAFQFENNHSSMTTNTPIDQSQQGQQQQSPCYSNEPDSPFSTGGSSSLSPPPPNQSMSPQSQCRSRGTSPGPAPSPTSSRQRMHHQLNNAMIGVGQRQSTIMSTSSAVAAAAAASNAQVSFYGQSSSDPASPANQTTGSTSGNSSPGHLRTPSPLGRMRSGSASASLMSHGSSAHPYHQQQPQQQQQQQYFYQSQAQASHQHSQPPPLQRPPPQITVEGLVMDTSALNLNGDTLSSPSGFVNPQLSFGHFNSNGLQFGSMHHRSTTPISDSVSAPTSPASQQISPANSPDIHSLVSSTSVNGSRNGSISSQSNFVSSGYGVNNANGAPAANNNNNNNNQNQQQTTMLQHQLEQIRMNELPSPQQSTPTSAIQLDNGNNFPTMCNTIPVSGQGGEIFYLESLVPYTEQNISNIVTNGGQHHQQQQQQQQQQQHQPQMQQFHFTGETNIGMLDLNTMNTNFYDPSQIMTIATGLDDGQGLQFFKNMNSTPTTNGLYSTQNGQTMNMSNCTTPQTPSSIPNIVLTTPSNLDYLTTSSSTVCNGNDFSIKDLNPTVNASFDSTDIANYFPSGDSFDLDTLQTDLDPPISQC